MGDVVTTMTLIVVANAILLPLAAYGCMRLGLLPGVDWYWPFQRHRGGTGHGVVAGFAAVRGYGFISPYDEATSEALDALMESADGKLHLIIEVQDEAEIRELQRQAQQVPARDIVRVRALSGRSGLRGRAALNLRAWLRTS